MEMEDALEAETYSTMNWKEIYRVNRVVFGHDRFRPGQRSAIHATLSGQDAFILMRTSKLLERCFL